VPATPTYIEEMLAAARGTWAMLIGNRQAPSYFDLSMRGLISSGIALLVALVVGTYVPVVLGAAHEPGALALGLVRVGIVYVLQIAFGAIALRQIKRLDGLVPYLVAANWASAWASLLATVLMSFGLGDQISTIIFGIALLVIEINIARLIVTLSPLQIAMFLIAQMVGGSIGFLIIFLTMPLSPDMAAALAGI
jgi:hypothetical protein